MPIGNDFETYWRNLRDGVTGTRLIRSFDASEFEVRIAAEVIGFDPGAVMEALQQRADAASGLHQDNRPLFAAGEAIKLMEGPLAGMEGVFTQQDGDQRVIVLLELLGKANKVSVSRDWIARAA